MQKTDLLEIKKLFRYPDCSFEKMAFAVVSSLLHDGQEPSERIDYTGENLFLTRDDEEQKSFLALLQKAFCFQEGVSSSDVEVAGDIKKLLSSFAFSDSTSVLNIFPLACEIVKDYGMIKSYALVLFKGSYDIPIKDESKTKTGESEEVYKYVALMLCPIEVSKVGLSPKEGDIKRGDIVRILKQPLFGLLYPSFTDRASDDEHAFVCCRKEEEVTLANLLFDSSVPVPVKKEKAVLKQNISAPEDSDEQRAAGGFSAPTAAAVSPSQETQTSIPAMEQTGGDYSRGYTANDEPSYTVNDIDSALLKKRSAASGDEEEPGQNIEVKEDKSVISNDKVTERDIGGKKYFIIPRDLLPEDILEKILELGI